MNIPTDHDKGQGLRDLEMTREVTHYVRYNAAGGRLARAECGRLVDRYRDHANEPTCPDCQRLRAEFEALEIE